jgi:hypothetical protein
VQLGASAEKMNEGDGEDMREFAQINKRQRRKEGRRKFIYIFDNTASV